MPNPTRISDLPLSNPQAGDFIPIARTTGLFPGTYKLFADQIIASLLNTSNTPSINLTFNTSTRTLSAEAALIPVNRGGTGAVTPEQARINLGIGPFGTVQAPIPILSGGTGATTAAQARTNLGLGVFATLSAANTVHIENNAVTNAKMAFDGGAFSLRNKIINGDMEIDQRNAGAVLTIAAGTNVYSLDRWYGAAIGGSVTHQKVSVASVPGIKYGLRVTGSAGNTNAWVAQRIESAISDSLAGKQVTLSFYIASSSLTQLVVGWGGPVSSTADDWSASGSGTFQSLAVTPTLTRYSVTFTAGSDFNRGAYIAFYANAPLLAGQTITVTGVQLEEGPVATPFEHRPIGLELSLCQRYYEYGRNYDARWGNAIFASGGSYYATNEINVNYKVNKRAVPTINFPYRAISSGANVSTIFMGPSTFVPGWGTVIGGTSATTQNFFVSWAPIYTGTDAAPFFDWRADAEL